MWELIPKLIPQLGASVPAVPSKVARRWFFITEDSRKCYFLRECCRDERGRKEPGCVRSRENRHEERDMRAFKGALTKFMAMESMGRKRKRKEEEFWSSSQLLAG